MIAELGSTLKMDNFRRIYSILFFLILTSFQKVLKKIIDNFEVIQEKLRRWWKFQVKILGEKFCRNFVKILIKIKKNYTENVKRFLNSNIIIPALLIMRRQWVERVTKALFGPLQFEQIAAIDRFAHPKTPMEYFLTSGSYL